MKAQTTTETVLAARNLYRFYYSDDDETLALRGVSLRVGAGEMVAIVGPSERRCRRSGGRAHPASFSSWPAILPPTDPLAEGASPRSERLAYQLTGFLPKAACRWQLSNSCVGLY